MPTGKFLAIFWISSRGTSGNVFQENDFKIPLMARYRTNLKQPDIFDEPFFGNTFQSSKDSGMENIGSLTGWGQIRVIIPRSYLEFKTILSSPTNTLSSSKSRFELEIDKSGTLVTRFFKTYDTLISSNSFSQSNWPSVHHFLSGKPWPG